MTSLSDHQLWVHTQHSQARVWPPLKANTGPTYSKAYNPQQQPCQTHGSLRHPLTQASTHTRSYLQVPAVCLPKLLEPEVSLTGIEGGWRCNTGTLAGWAWGDGFHSVEVFLPGGPLVDPLAGVSAQGSHYTLALTVRALRHGLNFVIVSEQLDKERENRLRVCKHRHHLGSWRRLSVHFVRCPASQRPQTALMWSWKGHRNTICWL